MDSLQSRIEKIKNYLSGGNSYIKMLLNFFKTAITSSQTYSSSIKSNIDHLLKYCGNAGDPLKDSWNQCMQTLQQFMKSFDEIIISLQMETVETLEELIKNYEKTHEILLKETELKSKEIDDIRSNLNKAKNEYEQCTLLLEKNEVKLYESKQRDITFKNMNEMEKIHDLYIDSKMNLEKSEKDYCQLVIKTNYIINEYKPRLKILINDLIASDQDRNTNMTILISKFPKFFNKLIQIMTKYNENLNSLFKDTELKAESPMSNEKIFNLEKSDNLVEVDFIPAINSQRKKSTRASDVIIDKEGKVNLRNQNSNEEMVINFSDTNTIMNSRNKYFDLDTDKEVMSEAINILFKNEIISNKDKIFEILGLSRGLRVFASILENIKLPIIFTNSESFNTFVEIVNCYLTRIIKLKEDNPLLIYHPLAISKEIYYKEKENRKIFLFSMISDHEIWKDYSKWIFLIEKVLQIKIKNFKISNEKLEKMKEEQRNRSNTGDFTSFLKNPIKKVAQIFKKPTDLTNSLEVGMRNIVFEVLNSFVFYLSSFHVPKDKAFKMLYLIGYKNSLPIEKNFDLYTEFLTYEPVSNLSMQKLIGMKKSLVITDSFINQNEKNQESCINILMTTIKFISDLKILRNELIISKKVNKELTKQVFKHVIFKLNLMVKFDYRKQMWMQILEINSLNNIHFNKLKEEAELNQEQIKNQVECIRMDIERSYNHIQEIDKNSLNCILKTFAYYDKSIDYCQGMNYLVGFLRYVLPDDETSFKALIVLIDKYKLREIYKKDMPLLFFSFFVIEILLNKFVPELHLHLKLNSVIPQHYASSCVITIFTHILEQSKVAKIPKILIAFWDSFLLDKWKGVYKSILFLIENVPNLLLEEKFENIIIRINEMCKFDESKDEEMTKIFRKTYLTRKIKNELIKVIENQYIEIKNITESMKQNDPEKLKLSK